MRTHVTWRALRCFCMLRQLWTIKRSVPADTFQGLLVSLVLSWLDCGNDTLAGLPANLLSQLQAVMNAGARLIFNANRRQSLLCQLHWLRVPEWITFKLATLMFQCINGTAPGYLSADVPGRKRLHSAASSSLAIPATGCSIIGDRTLIVTAASVWNRLPQEIRSATSLPVFRRGVKTHPFDCVNSCKVIEVFSLQTFITIM